jgi:hypothetical protein
MIDDEPGLFVVFLDSGPYGLVTNPKESPESRACKGWLRHLVRAGHQPLVPAIVDYEVRRELKLYRRSTGLHNLDVFKSTYGCVDITPDALLQAAEFWAIARRSGLPTADRLALDADVILAAQAATLDPAMWGMPGSRVVIATDNVGHLARFVDARKWRDIS